MEIDRWRVGSEMVKSHNNGSDELTFKARISILLFSINPGHGVGYSGFCPIFFFFFKHISLSSGNRLLFAAYELENRWLLEIVGMPWDLLPWNVQTAEFKPRCPGCQRDSWHLFTHQMRSGKERETWAPQNGRLPLAEHLLWFCLELLVWCMVLWHPCVIDMPFHPFHRWAPQPCSSQTEFTSCHSGPQMCILSF